VVSSDARAKALVTIPREAIAAAAYARAPDAFSADDEALAADLAGIAGTVLTNVSAYRSAVELSEQLHEAMASRP